MSNVLNLDILPAIKKQSSILISSEALDPYLLTT